MTLLRKIGFGLCALLFGASVSLLITLATLNQTFLQRTVVKDWLASSNIYNAFVNLTLDANVETLKETLTTGSIISAEVITQSLKATFSPVYVQAQAEVALDKTYDWLEGKTSSLAISVNLAEQKPAFAAAVEKAVQPKLEALPACPSNKAPSAEDAVQGRCMPRGISPAALAKQTGVEVSDGTDIFQEGPALEGQAKGTISTEFNDSRAPLAVSIIKMLLVALWPLALLSGIGMIFLASTKERGVRAIGWRLLFAGLFVVIPGVLLLTFGSTLSLSNLATNHESSTTIGLVEIVLHQALPDIGWFLTLYGSITAAIGGIALLVLWILRKKRPLTTEETPKTPEKPPAPTPTAV